MSHETTSAPSQVRRVGYVVSLFPSYDETFILREMAALADRGVTLRIFSLRQRKQAVVQEAARRFLPATRYAPYLLSGEVLAALGRALLRQPGTLLSIVALVVRGAWRRPMALAKSLAFLPKAVRYGELAREDRLERLHAHWATYPATVTLAMSRLTGIPWGLTCHAHDIFFDPSLLPEKIEAAEFVLTCTGDNKRHLETLTPAARKVRVSYHGLDLQRFQPGPAAAAAQPPRVLAVGSLLECKGFDILIAAVGQLRRRGLVLDVTIAGGGPEEERLRAAARNEGVEDRVRFTGFLTQEELIPLYQEADVFVLPAVLEIHWGIPNVLVEALACRVPVVTTALPSLPELVDDGVHGLVARNRDPVDLADKIEQLIRDPEQRRRMGEAGRQRVEERFDLEANIHGVMRALGAVE
jgi:glycosyltransferase involved in cell wall biosynthesis